ncbi:hypothetical protein NST63_26675 [Heyndrickxia sp. FSL W8-0496]|uniref:hypothetical protein n=1 Tax=Heyndrickxia TaxID=2837504 RepID=UPI0030F6850E
MSKNVNLKKFLVLMFSVFLLLPSISSAAESTEYKYKTLEEFYQAAKILKADSSKTEEEIGDLLLKNTDPIVLNQYFDEFFNEVNSSMEVLMEKANKESLNINTKNNNGTILYNDKIYLSHGEKVQIIIKDEPEASIGITGSEYKEYGNRRYTATFKINAIAWPDSTISLVNHYKIGSYGLKMTSVDSAGTTAIFPTTIKVVSTDITDGVAEKVGYDINGRGQYTVTIGGYNGIGLITRHYTLTSTIKLEKLYNDAAVVNQSFSVKY